jgi:hypothetical protein
VCTNPPLGTGDVRSAWMFAHFTRLGERAFVVCFLVHCPGEVIVPCSWDDEANLVIPHKKITVSLFALAIHTIFSGGINHSMHGVGLSFVHSGSRTHEIAAILSCDINEMLAVRFDFIGSAGEQKP